MARNLARTYLPPLASLDIPCYWFTAIRCGMLLPLMAWPSRTSWSAWKFPQRCSPHRPDPRESATSRAEPVFLLVPSHPTAFWDCHRTLWFVLFCVGIVLVYGALLARRHLRPFAALIQLAVFSLSDGWLLAGNSGRRWGGGQRKQELL